MKIESYSFGKMQIDNNIYTNDLIVYPVNIFSNWWRKEGHLLQVEDLKKVIDAKPDLLIIGTGHSGMMKVPDALKQRLSDSGIEVLIDKTDRAVQLYNQADKAKKVIGCFHLTC